MENPTAGPFHLLPLHKKLQELGSKPQSSFWWLLTGQDVLVAVLGLVLRPLSLFPGIQELAFLLLQHLWGQQREKPVPEAKENLLGIPSPGKSWQEGREG